MSLTTEQYNLWRSKKYNPGENKSDSDGGKFKRQKVFAREKKEKRKEAHDKRIDEQFLSRRLNLEWLEQQSTLIVVLFTFGDFVGFYLNFRDFCC